VGDDTGEGDDLYALPLEEFTAARNARAKELTKAGKRDEAAVVKALKKPSVSAWALNQVSRNHADEVDRFLDRVDELRAAQDRAMGGDASGLRHARTAHEEAQQEVADLATAELGQHGHGATTATRDRVLDTLRAAAVDDDARAVLRAGRLVEDLRATGLETLGDVPLLVEQPSPERTSPRDEAARRRAEELAAAADDAEAEAEELRQQAVRAERDARTLRERAEAAAATAKGARERSDKAAADL